MIKFKANGLRSIMKEKNMSIQQLANLSKINSHVIQGLLDDTISITSNNIISLSKVLDSSFEYLLLNECRKPITLDIKKLNSNQTQEILLLQANFKKLDFKNISSYTELLLVNSSKEFYGDFCFSEKCVNIRKNLLDLTQAQLASFLNISETSIHNWEAGHNRPSFNSLFALSIMSGFTIDYLYADGTEIEISPYNLTDDNYSILQSIINEYYK